MNSLAHICAALVLLWLAAEVWNTFDERLLGVAIFGMSLLYWGLTAFVALPNDLRWMSGKNDDD